MVKAFHADLLNVAIIDRKLSRKFQDNNGPDVIFSVDDCWFVNDSSDFYMIVDLASGGWHSTPADSKLYDVKFVPRKEQIKKKNGNKD